MNRVIAKRYAKALIGLVEKDSQIDKINEDLSQLAQTYVGSSDLRHFIKEPKYKLTDKVEGLGKITSALELDELVGKFGRFLVTRHRFELVNTISTAFDLLALERLGKGRAKVVTATKLTVVQTRLLTKQLSAYTKKDITLEVEVDPSILGGAITQIGSLVLDGSVKNQLNQIRETISRGN